MRCEEVIERIGNEKSIRGADVIEGKRRSKAKLTRCSSFAKIPLPMSAMGMGAILQDSIRVRGQCQCVNRAGYKYDEKASLIL